jgi:hypothetical protein
MSKSILVELSDALADAAELAGKSTVLVDARRRMPASGILFAPELVLTAEHVVEKDEDITVAFADGTDASSEVAGRDAGSDLAVLKLERPAGTVAEITKTPGRLGQIALALPPDRELKPAWERSAQSGDPSKPGAVECWSDITAPIAFRIPAFPVVHSLRRMEQFWDSIPPAFRTEQE